MQPPKKPRLIESLAHGGLTASVAAVRRILGDDDGAAENDCRDVRSYVSRMTTEYYGSVVQDVMLPCKDGTEYK